MVATTNIPGSKYFAYFVGTRTECEQWLEAQKQSLQSECGGLWFNAFGPGKIVPNKTAAQWKYRDGSKVVSFGLTEQTETK